MKSAANMSTPTRGRSLSISEYLGNKNCAKALCKNGIETREQLEAYRGKEDQLTQMKGIGPKYLQIIKDAWVRAAVAEPEPSDIVAEIVDKATPPRPIVAKAA